MANYSFGKPLPEVENGAIIEGHNFSQLYSHTPIFAGKTGLTFRNCNLLNCDIPEDAICDGFHHQGHASFCTNLHPKYVTMYNMTPCVANCSHVTETDTVTIDGVVVATIYHYENTVVS